VLKGSEQKVSGQWYIDTKRIVFGRYCDLKHFVSKSDTFGIILTCMVVFL